MKRNASVTWSGSAREGHGSFRVGRGALTAPFTYNSRFVGDSQTNPEELLLSALAGCLTIAMAAALKDAKGGGEIETSAELDLVPRESMAELRRRADSLLEMEPPTVVAKQVLPPSGDVHDYLSIAPYWWPVATLSPMATDDAEFAEVLHHAARHFGGAFRESWESRAAPDDLNELWYGSLPGVASRLRG
jgi:OsmC-like protein